MKKLIITILLLSIALPVFSQPISNGEFECREKPCIMITETDDYFAWWIGERLGSMAIKKATGKTRCWIVAPENPYQATDCSDQEFSSLLFMFPYELIEDLK